MMAPMFVLFVRFDLPDAAAAATFDELVRDAVPDILADEPGTLTYTTHTVIDEPLARIFYEVYRDREAHADHESRPATSAFLAAIRGLRPTVRVEAAVPDRR